jgi:hypothetical protein
MKKSFFILCILSTISCTSIAQDEDSIARLTSKVDSLLTIINGDARPKSVLVLGAIGGNLDLVNNLKVNGFYFDVDFGIPSLHKNSKSRFKDVGVFGRISQGRDLSDIDTLGFDRISYYDPSSLNEQNPLRLITEDIRISKKVTSTYLAAQLTPSFRIFGSPRKSSLYAIYHAEFYRYEITSEFSHTVLYSDTTDQLNTWVDGYFPPRQNYYVNKQVFYSFNNALGLLYSFRSKFVSIVIRATFGVTELWGYKDPGFYYNIRAEVFENKVGFKIGFETRGMDLFVISPYTNERESVVNPNFSLFFAKTINFSNLKSLIGG